MFHRVPWISGFVCTIGRLRTWSHIYQVLELLTLSRCNGLNQPETCLDPMWRDLLPTGGNRSQEGTNQRLFFMLWTRDLLLWWAMLAGRLPGRFNYAILARLVTVTGLQPAYGKKSHQVRQGSFGLYQRVTHTGETKCELPLGFLHGVCRALRPTKIETGILELEDLWIRVVHLEAQHKISLIWSV